MEAAKGGDDLERKPSGGRKTVLDPRVLKEAVENEPMKSLWSYAKDLGVGATTVRRAVKMFGGKSLMREERLLLTEKI